MSKFDEKLEAIVSSLKEMKVDYDTDLLTKIAKGLGPSIYNADAAYVSTSDKSEVDRLKQNFLIKKLGLSESDNLDEAIEKVTEIMGKSNPRKHRAVFYYLLVKHFGKEEIYQ